MSGIIRMENVVYEIEDHNRKRRLLDNITYDFQKSEITVISGPSGSGKTTLLYAIAGLLEHVNGKIMIENTQINVDDTKKKNDFRLNNLSMVFQNLNLFSFMNVEDNILVPYYVKEKKVDDKVRKNVSRYLNLMNLGQIQKQSIQSLSGGEQQRVAIIRALIDNPKVVLCDEPTASLDSANVDIFMKTLIKMKEETKATIIIVTHDGRVFDYGENQVLIVDGKLKA